MTKNISNSIQKILEFLFVIVLLVSCQKDPNDIQFEIGSDIIKTVTGLTTCDTFTIELSTVQADSIITSTSDSMLVGGLLDARLGKISSKCFFRLSIPKYVNIKEGDVYDSISLVVKLNGYYYGDTLNSISWNVYNVYEEMKTNDDGYLYNTSSFICSEDPLGNISFRPYPGMHQKIYIPINMNFGKSLFNMVITDDERLQTTENFIEFFKGLTIEPAVENMNTLLGIDEMDSSVILRIYAHRNGEERQELEQDFQIETGSLPFSQISYDRSQTLLENLKDQSNEISSHFTGNESYIEGGVGLMMRVDIPGLSKLLELENTRLIKAQLILKPVIVSMNKSQLPSTLKLTKCDKLNRILNAYSNESGSDYVYGILFDGDDLYNENTFYSIDITPYIEDELSDKYFEAGNTGILLYYSEPDYLATASSIILGDMRHPNAQSFLRLYFLNY
jgi:hypothetical protein